MVLKAFLKTTNTTLKAALLQGSQAEVSLQLHLPVEDTSHESSALTSNSIKQVLHGVLSKKLAAWDETIDMCKVLEDPSLAQNRNVLGLGAFTSSTA